MSNWFYSPGKRGVVCRVLCFLSGNIRSGLKVDARGLTIPGHHAGVIPFVEISGLSRVRKRLFRSAIEIPLMNGSKVVFSCLASARAEKFVGALNEAWQEAWRRKIEPCVDSIRSLEHAIDRLDRGCK